MYVQRQHGWPCDYYRTAGSRVQVSHIPQVNGTGHCFIDKLPNHADSLNLIELGDTFNAIHLSLSW